MKEDKIKIYYGGREVSKEYVFKKMLLSALSKTGKNGKGQKQ